MSRASTPSAFYDEGHAEAEALCTHRFNVRGRSYYCSRAGQIAVVAMIVACTSLVLAGSIMDSFVFHFKGAVGLALEVLGQQV